MKLKFIYILLGVMCLLSCHKDVNDDNLNSVEETQITVPYQFNEIEGDLIGYVFDENNQPLDGVSLSIYSDHTTSNDLGVFLLEDVKMDGQGTFLKASKSGYIDASDYIYPNDQGAGSARIQMIKISDLNSFESSIGGTFSFENEGTVDITSNSIALQNGSSYDGNVNVNISYANPESEDYGVELQSGLIGQADDLKNVSLAAYGSVGVSLTNNDGAGLNIKSDKTIKIKLPIPSSYASIAQGTTKVWKLDTSTGIWEEVGTAVKNAGYYEIEVANVGYYIFADGYDITHYCARLVDEASLAAKNYKFRVLVDEKIVAIGLSDDDGYICTKLPREQYLQLEILHPVCNVILLEKSIGPFSAPANESDIMVQLESELRSGIVTCNDDPVANALIIIRNQNKTILSTSNAQGNFNINLNGIVCADDDIFELLAYSGGQVSPKVNASTENMQNITLEVCKTECEYEVSFLLEKLDFCESGNYDVATVSISGGSGEFSYQWADGAIGVSNSSLMVNSNTCVTVTDVASGCTVDHCELITEYRTVTLENIVSYNNDCTQNGGIAEVSVTGGVKPYTFSWQSDSGFSSVERVLNSVSPGYYSVTINDANQCEITSGIEVFDLTIPIVSMTTKECEVSIINIIEQPGYGPFLYSWAGGTSSNNSLVISQPGEYAVTVTDQNGCTRKKSFEIGAVGIDVPLNTERYCEIDRVYFEAIAIGQTYFYEDINTNERVSLVQDNGAVDIPILESGYRFIFGTAESDLGCEASEVVELPHFLGLQIDNVQNPSCAECSDGYINVFLDNNQPCNGGCVTGDVIILDKLSGGDVTSENSQSALGAGIYIVVVLDADSGCYIAHEEVELQ